MDADPETATGMLDELRADVQVTLDELRELAHGIYPPLLRDRGLPDALQTAANRAALPTTVEADGVGRHDTDLEAAVYFCCLEAMQNAGKHAGDGARMCVAVGNGAGALWFEVARRRRRLRHGTERAKATVSSTCATASGPSAASWRCDPSVGEGTTIRGTVPVGTALGEP